MAPSRAARVRGSTGSAHVLFKVLYTKPQRVNGALRYSRAPVPQDQRPVRAILPTSDRPLLTHLQRRLHHVEGVKSTPRRGS